jgi:hypothetical protein
MIGKSSLRVCSSTLNSRLSLSPCQAAVNICMSRSHLVHLGHDLLPGLPGLERNVCRLANDPFQAFLLARISYGQFAGGLTLPPTPRRTTNGLISPSLIGALRNTATTTTVKVPCTSSTPSHIFCRR